MKEHSFTHASSPHVKVLMYHRVDAPDTDPWGICVSPERFREQIEFLTNHFRVISVADAINHIKTGSIAGNSICITFDDGYADNYVQAKPILERYHCPATFFIATAFTGATKPFWWDELEMIFLHAAHLPDILSLSINEFTHNYTITETELSDKQWTQHTNWKWYDAPPTSRCAVFLTIWETLRPLSEAAIQRQMTTIRAWAGSGNGAYNHRLPMTEEQLRSLSQNRLFTIGLHTHTHPDLGVGNKAAQLAEMLLCKQILFTRYGVDSNCLAYPYGRYNSATPEAAGAAGITTCFTTEAKCIDRHSDLITLGRYQVGDWDAGYLQAFLRGE